MKLTGFLEIHITDCMWTQGHCGKEGHAERETGKKERKNDLMNACMKECMNKRKEERMKKRIQREIK